MIDVRAAAPTDVPELAALLELYMKEQYGRAWNGSPEALERDGFGARFDVMVAARGGELVGFAAWAAAYDLHHCVAGSELIDLFVRKDARARGVALLLIAAAASEARARGAVYMKGLAVGAPATRRLYERVAMSFDGADIIVGGRAFRALAELAGRPLREMLLALPRKEWNYQP
ncbi:MAG TPA: GNAT family N-acetyltransferase [Polyangia bacterium]|nr:GNAT family N-acetyltransferase [Polyangia bacterium]